MSSKPDTTIGDKLCNEFFKLYRELIKDLCDAGNILTNKTINTLIKMIDIIKILDPPSPSNTLQNVVLDAYSDYNKPDVKEDEQNEIIKKLEFKLNPLKTLITPEEIKMITEYIKDRNIDECITLINNKFVNPKTNLKISKKIADFINYGMPEDAKFRNLVTIIDNRINFNYTRDNFLAIIGAILNLIVTVKKSTDVLMWYMMIKHCDNDLNKFIDMVIKMKSEEDSESKSTSDKIYEYIHKEKRRDSLMGETSDPSESEDMLRTYHSPPRKVVIGGTIKDYPIHDSYILYIDEHKKIRKILLQKVAVIISSYRKKDVKCEDIIKMLKEIDASPIKYTDGDIKTAILTANPCLTSATPSNPATSSDCDELMDKLGLSEFKPREDTITAANWGAIQKSANLINLRSDPLDCTDALNGMSVVFLPAMKGGNNYTMEGGDINSLRGLKDMKGVMPMPSFSGQVVDMAVKLLEGLRRSNVKVDDNIFDEIEKQIENLKTQEKDVFEKLQKLKEVVDLSARVSGGDENELSDLDPTTVDNLKDKLKEDIRRLLKRSECMQRLIVGASFGW